MIPVVSGGFEEACKPFYKLKKYCPERENGGSFPGRCFLLYTEFVRRIGSRDGLGREFVPKGKAQNKRTADPLPKRHRFP